MKKLILLLFMVGSALLCFSQSRVITGRITDETGNALPGVTVIQRGTTNSTTTNEEGNQYIWPIPQTEILVNRILVQNPGY
ncbi:MAG: RagB/SusD family nutrient uptake outer membrane protein [Flavisolibacter sp.]|nr:RagB/SusD family nutrient uptake outer membrane protein [Flavisolibacter sp.]